MTHSMSAKAEIQHCSSFHLLSHCNLDNTLNQTLRLLANGVP